MKEEREIRSVLHDGTEVVFNTGDRVLFLASRPGGMPLTIDADSLVDDLILTLEQKDATIKELQGDLRDIKALIKAKWYETAEKSIDAALGEGDTD